MNHKGTETQRRREKSTEGNEGNKGRDAIETGLWKESDASYLEGTGAQREKRILTG